MYTESPGLRQMLDYIDRFHEGGFETSPEGQTEFEHLKDVKSTLDTAIESEDWEKTYEIARKLYTLAHQYVMKWLFNPRAEPNFSEDGSFA